MAIYWFDPNKVTVGVGTFADPYGMINTANRPAVVNAGDECRIIGKSMSTLLTPTVYEINARDYAASSAGLAIRLTTASQYTDFAQYDIVYFPEFDVFARLPAAFTASGICSSTYYSDFPLPCGRDYVTTMRKVNMAQISASTSSTWYLLTNSTTALPNGGVIVTDNWIDETTRVTDNTVKTLIANAGTSTSTLMISSTTLNLNSRFTANLQRSTFDLSNTHIIMGRSSGASSTLTNSFPFSDTVLSQLQSQGSSTPIIGFGASSSSAMYNYDSTVRVKNLNSYSSVNLTCDNKFALTIDKFFSYTQFALFSSGETFTQASDGLTVNIGDVYCKSLSNALVNVTGSTGMTYNLNGKGYCWDSATTIGSVIVGGGDITINYSPTFEIITNMASLTTGKVLTISGTLVNDSTASPVGKEDYYKIPELPPNMTFTGTDAFKFVVASAVQYKVHPLRAATRSLLLDGLNIPTINVASLNRWMNTQVISVDNKFDPFEVLGIFGFQYVSAISTPNSFVASKDYAVYHTKAPSMKLELKTFNTTFWGKMTGAPEPYSVKNIFIPTVQGKSYTVTMKVRTDDVTYADGDFAIYLCRHNGDVINVVKPPVDMINAFVDVTMTYSATVSEEIFLAFKMKGYKGGQVYWVSDLVVA